MKSIQISTVDAFQGGEKDVIILSTVRSSESQFMDNQPRVNVALTRAKRHLIILGNRNVFSMNELWSKVLWDCQGKYRRNRENNGLFILTSSTIQFRTLRQREWVKVFISKDR